MKTIQCYPTVILPPKHFAILFEGAWRFTPEGQDRILATCPLPDDGVHECRFGIWNGGDHTIEPLDGFDPTMPVGDCYHVKLHDHDFEKATNSFDTLFKTAAHNYQILYIPQKKSNAREDQSPTLFTMAENPPYDNVRRVHVPLPNLVAADGALITAEIDGAGIEYAEGSPAASPRPVTTFLFVYEYCGSDATAFVIDPKSEETATITAGEWQPIPHLIFNVHPTGLMYMDESALKSHTTATFETLRRSVSTHVKVGEMTMPSLCDISIYHERGGMKFLYGNTGLDQYELGLAKHGPHPEGPDLASCASGNMAVDG